MKTSLIPGWLRRAVHREDKMEKMTKTIDILQQQLSHALYMNGKLERDIEALTKEPVGASAEEWKKKYLSALSYIIVIKHSEGYEQHLKLTQGRDYKEIISHYAAQIPCGISI